MRKAFVLSLVILALVSHNAYGEGASVSKQEGPNISINPEGYVAAMYAAHLRAVAEIPFEYGVMMYAAAKEQGIHPYDLAAVVIGENSWSYGDFSLVGAWDRSETAKFDYIPDEEGADGEVGIAQVMPSWAKKARKTCFEEGWRAGQCDQFTVENRNQATTNLRLAAFVVRMAQESHVEEGQTNHHWVAHYKCARKSRDSKCGQCGYAKRKFKRIRHSLVSWDKPVHIWKRNIREYARYRCSTKNKEVD